MDHDPPAVTSCRLDDHESLSDPVLGRDTHASKGLLLAAMLVSAVLSVAAFLPALHNEFVYDDGFIIAENPNVTTPGAWYRAWREPYWPRGTSSDKLYRPLTIWSFRVNHLLSGRDRPDPVVFRVVNIALHALTAAGVVLAASRLARHWLAGLTAGSLFATHPIHTEAVVTGYGRAEVLAACFSVWLLARHMRPACEARARATRFNVVSALLFLGAIMSKEHALFVWPAILLIDVWPRQSRVGVRLPLRAWLNRVIGPSHIGFALSATTYFLLRFWLFGQFYRLESSRVRIWESPMAHATLMEHLLTPFRLTWLTLKLLVWPEALCPIWSIPALSPAARLAPDVLAGMLLVACLLGAGIFLWRRKALTGALVLGLLLILALPVQAISVAHWIYAERWLYLPTVFVAILISATLSRMRRVGAAAAVALAIVLLPATWNYSSAFASNLTMNREVVRRQPDNFQGRRNLASVLYVLGDYTGAIEAANEVIDRFKPVKDPYDLLARSYLELGEGRLALDALEKYLSFDPDLPGADRSPDRRRALALIEARARRRVSATATASVP